MVAWKCTLLRTIRILKQRKFKCVNTFWPAFLLKNILSGCLKQFFSRLSQTTDSYFDLNLCVAIIRKARKDYYNNLNKRDITDNKQFWKTVKRFFSNKVGGNEKITLIAVSEDNAIAETFKSYFETIVESLIINSKYMSGEPLSDESVTDIIRKLDHHPSTINIKKNQQGHFSFSAVELQDVNEEIDLLDPS